LLLYPKGRRARLSPPNVKRTFAVRKRKVFALLLESGREYHIGSSSSESFPFSFDAMPCAWVVETSGNGGWNNQRANICTHCVPLLVRGLGVGTMAGDTIHHEGSQKKESAVPPGPVHTGT
jgi:hypothetical protein